jgi:ankyrin repeat protein
LISDRAKQFVRSSSIAGLALLALAGSAGAATDLRLIEAARNRNVSAVVALLKEHVDVNAAQPDGTTALHWAAQWDDLKMADALIRGGAHARAANDYGATPLALAAVNGSAEMIRRLMKAGADPNAALPSGETALMTAARSGHVDAVQALLASGANTSDAEHEYGQTALMWAAAERHVDVVHALVDKGADTRARSKAGFTPFLFAARAGSRELVELFLSKGADVNEVSTDGTTALLAATVRGFPSLAEWLLDEGADPNKDTAAGYSALHWAAGTFDTVSTHEYQTESGEWSALAGIQPRSAKIHLIKALLEHGANVNARMRRGPPRFGYTLGGGGVIGGGSYAGGTAFFLASTVGDVEVMRLLVASGADPLLSTNDHTTPLMAASGISMIEAESSSSEKQLIEGLKLTIELGNDIRAANDAGTTAVHAATYGGFNQIIQFLVDHGADINAYNNRGETPLKIANGIPMSGMFYFQPASAALLTKLGGKE